MNSHAYTGRAQITYHVILLCGSMGVYVRMCVTHVQYWGYLCPQFRVSFSWYRGTWKNSFVLNQTIEDCLVSIAWEQEWWSLWLRYFVLSRQFCHHLFRTPTCLRGGWMDTDIFVFLNFLFSPVFLSLASCSFLDHSRLLYFYLYSGWYQILLPWNHFLSLR